MAPPTQLITLAIALSGFMYALATPVATDDALTERDAGTTLDVCRAITCVTGNSDSTPSDSFRICCQGGNIAPSDSNANSGSMTSNPTDSESTGLVVTYEHVNNTGAVGSLGEGSSNSSIIDGSVEAAPDQSEPAGVGLKIENQPVAQMGPQHPSSGTAGARAAVFRLKSPSLPGDSQSAGADGGSGNTGGSSASGANDGNQGPASGGTGGGSGNTGGSSASGANDGNQGPASGGTGGGSGNTGDPSNSPSNGAGSSDDTGSTSSNSNSFAPASASNTANQGSNSNGSGSRTTAGQQGSNANNSGGSTTPGDQGANLGTSLASFGSGPTACTCVCQ